MSPERVLVKFFNKISIEVIDGTVRTNVFDVEICSAVSSGAFDVEARMAISSDVFTSRSSSILHPIRSQFYVQFDLNFTSNSTSIFHTIRPQFYVQFDLNFTSNSKPMGYLFFADGTELGGHETPTPDNKQLIEIANHQKSNLPKGNLKGKDSCGHAAHACPCGGCARLQAEA